MKLTILLLIFWNYSFANFDFQYGTSIRSYPSVGGDINAELGYNQILWGSQGNSPWYGLIRPSIIGSSSAVVSHYDLNITVYPVSFIGFGSGHKEMSSNYSDFTYYDCDKIRCEGSLIKDYSFAKLALGYGHVLTSFTYSEYRNAYSLDEENPSFEVGEYEYILTVTSKNETQIRRTYFAGYKDGDNIFGVVSDQIQFLESRKDYQLNIGIYQFQLGFFKTVIGFGTLQSTDQKPGLVGVLKLTHTLLPSMALF
jgi:hypothetical protein